jgi:oligoribonuclease NrnB/cAMP/cGMP phosphodiesterase (DHH superfamily)
MDGTASAMCVYRYFQNQTDRKIKYYPASHGKSPPHLVGKNILICDFSYSYSVLQEMSKIANKILVIDHHKTAIDNLHDFPDNQKIFDLQHSGAYLTWKYLFPNEKVPLFIKMIEDRDLWTKQLPGTDYLAMYLFTEKYDFQLYLSLLDETTLATAIAKGETYSELNKFYMQQLADQAMVKFMRINNKYYFIVHCECALTVLRSDLGNYLLEKYPHADFSVTYHVKAHGITTFSLRSDDKHADVSEVARSLQGGGHRNAAGMAVNAITTNLPGVVLDNGGLHRLTDLIYFDIYREYHVVYLMSSLQKRALGKYLLQNRSGNVQNCRAIQGEWNEARCELVVVWNYHPGVDRSFYTVTIDPTLSLKEKSKIHRLFGADVHKTKFWSPGLISNFFDRSKIHPF